MTLRWSYDLLTGMEQAVLRRLAVFESPFTMDAAEQVCSDDSLSADDVADAVAGLIDQSLLTVIEDGPILRYRLLVVIREFAKEQLRIEDDEAEVRLSHLAWVLQVIDPVPYRLEPPETWWTTLIDGMLEEMLAARTAAIGSDDRTAVLHIVSRLCRWCFAAFRLARPREWVREVQAAGPVEPLELYGWTMLHAVTAWPEQPSKQAESYSECLEFASVHEFRMLRETATYLKGQTLATLGEPLGNVLLDEVMRTSDSAKLRALAQRTLGFVAYEAGDEEQGLALLAASLVSRTRSSADKS
jgi:hypothetical protein